MQGFKSFANKIDMSFDQGITGIVGPNGSGKSNISDGIRWVLGEQSIKSLRGSKTEDIIFSGTATKKPQGMAEVSLTLDNSLKILPVEFDEVTITRRVYRSGESEYYINKSLCRLKDIREMLMDTGIGKDGYSIIGQGKIDEILSNKSEDRRLVFEEAAGIVKYKSRKDDSQKKLQSTEDNLSRIADILGELEGQLGPLERQSKKAKKYLELRDKLLNLEVSLFVKEIDKHDNELKHIKDQLGVLDNSLKEQQSEKDVLIQELKIINNEINTIDEELTNLQNEKHQIENNIQGLEGKINLSKEKKYNGQQNINRITSEIKDAKHKEEQLRIEMENKLGKLKIIEKDIDEILGDLKESNEAYQLLLNKKLSKEKELESSKSYIIDSLNKISDKKSDANGYKTLIETMDAREKQIDRDIQINRGNLNSIISSIEDVSNRLQKEEISIRDTKIEIENLTSKSIHMQTDINNKYKELETTKNTLTHRSSRLKMLQDLEREHDGFSKGVKSILSACEVNKELGQGVHGAVANLIRVPNGYELALEIALGAAVQNVVSETEREAKKLIEHLKKYNLGRITVLPISAIKPKFINAQEENIIKSYKDTHIAYDLVDFDSKFSNIMSNLLKRVIIVPNLDVGIELAKKLDYKLKIVTIGGDILNIGGSLTGGSVSKNSNGIFERKKEMENLLLDVNTSRLDASAREKELENLKESLDDIRANLQQINNGLQDKMIERATLINRLEQFHKEKNQTEKSLEQLNNEKLQINNINSDTQLKLNDIIGEINKLELEIEGIKDSVESNKVFLESDSTEIQNLNNNITDIKIRLTSKEEQKKSILQDISNIQEFIRNNEDFYISKNDEVTSLINQSNDLETELKKNEYESSQLIISKRQIISDLGELTKKRDKTNDIKNYKKTEVDSVQLVIDELQDSIHKLDIKRTRLEMQQQTYYNKLWDEYELSYVDALEIKTDVKDISNTAKEIKDYKAQIKDLGTINEESIIAFEQVKERYEFLKGQQEDLIQAKISLEKVIKDMEETMKKQFIHYFNIIRENFNTVFKRLFGGGKADLILTDESDVLNCGIDIIAQPPGKKLQSLSLLSGGERALTAIAILFAILLEKPTPFCVLDEIEAALDDANVHRYAELLKDLSPKTQFIVVTHRKGTMESADALYGVTMEEEGISKLVSVKLMDIIEDEIAS